jgi:hypothetical protein
MKQNSLEIIMVFILVSLAVFLLNPFNLWMPDMMVKGMVVAVLVGFALLAGFVLREQPQDERDRMHQTLAGRNAFLAGLSVLIAGLVTQGLAHAVDPWLVAALVCMLIAKIATRLWSDTHL